jgi:hypothetical protein
VALLSFLSFAVIIDEAEKLPPLIRTKTLQVASLLGFVGLSFHLIENLSIFFISTESLGKNNLDKKYS